MNPGASEVCGNDVDEDCDGDAIACGGWEGEYVLPDTAVRVDGSRSNDWIGGRNDAGGDYDGDGQGDLLIGAQSAYHGVDHAGEVYVVAGPITADMSVDDAMVEHHGTLENDYAGHAARFIGDADLDGYDDVGIGMVTRQASTGYDSRVYVVHGPTTGPVDLRAGDDYWEPEGAEDWAGFSLAAGGDLTGDGTADLLVGASHVESYAKDSGAVYLLNGPEEGGGSLSSAYARIYGADSDMYLGGHVGVVGDANGDGFTDIVAGASGWHDSSAGYGAFLYFEGPLAGTLLSDSADGFALGPHTLEITERIQPFAGDVDLDGEGTDDLVVGNYYEHLGTHRYDGVVRVVHGPSLPTLTDLFLADAKLEGRVSDYALGMYVAVLDDVDGDGEGEIFTGAISDDTEESDAGIAFLIGGGITGTCDPEAEATATFYGGEPNWLIGTGLASGELTGDGYVDLVFGSPGHDGGGEGSGTVFVLPGGG